MLKYGAVVWDPHTVGHKNAFERVQRKFLKYAGFILKMYHPPHEYGPVLSKLDLSSLVDRRAMANFRFYPN